MRSKASSSPRKQKIQKLETEEQEETLPRERLSCCIHGKRYPTRERDTIRIILQYLNDNGLK
jgi:LisH-like dimerisation domain